MPSLKQLLTDAGVTLPENIDVAALVEGSDELKGLKAKNGELLTWQVTNKPVLEELQGKQAELEAAAKKALEEKEALAIQNKDYETLAQINADKLKQLEDGLNASRERTKASATDAARASVSALFNDEVYGKFYAEKSTVVELTETGEPVTKFKFGEQVFDKLDDWKAAAAKDATCAAHMPIGGENKGTGATGNGVQSGQQKPQQPKSSQVTQGYLANLNS